MNAAYLKSTLTNGSITEKLNALEYLKDQFDSFDKNIESFELLIDVLMNVALTESDMEVKIEVFEDDPSLVAEIRTVLKRFHVPEDTTIVVDGKRFAVYEQES